MESKNEGIQSSGEAASQERFSNVSEKSFEPDGQMDEDVVSHIQKSMQQRRESVEQRELQLRQVRERLGIDSSAVIASTLDAERTELDRIESLRPLVQDIKAKYLRAADTYLESGDPLWQRLHDFYTNRPETDTELLHVLSNKNPGEIEKYLADLENFLSDETRFIERMEKVHELREMHTQRRKYALNDRVATDEEYELGVYADVLEDQVREAVFVARRKGYVTFQSGFREKRDREQFMDFYNKEVAVPQETRERLRVLGVEVEVEHLDDRTTLTLRPVEERPIRISEWKRIWNGLVEDLPPADSVLVADAKEYQEHLEFRRRQDTLRRA